MTDSPVKHQRVFLERILEDIQDLLEYATERTDLSKIDDDLLNDAAGVLSCSADRAAPGFCAAAIGVLDRLTTAVRPATAGGIRFARHATREPRSFERRALARARRMAVGVLVSVFLIYGYIAYGQTIVRTIDTLRPQIDQVQEQLRTLIAAADPPGRSSQPRFDEPSSTLSLPLLPGSADHRNAATETPSAATGPGRPVQAATPPATARAPTQPPPAETAPSQAGPLGNPTEPATGDTCTRTGEEKAVGAAWLRECTRLTDLAHSLDSQFTAAYDRLHDWRDVLLSLPVFLALERRTDAVCFDEAGELAQYPHLPPAERDRLTAVVATSSPLVMHRPQCLGGRDDSYASADDLNAAAYGFRQRHEQQARSIIDTVSLLVLPGLFGLLGAMLASVRELHLAMSEQRIDPAMFERSNLQMLLGAVLGALTGVLFTQTVVAESFGLERFAVAFFAGFSVESAFRFLQGILDRALRSAREDRRDGRPGGRRRAREVREPSEPHDDRPPGEGERPRPIAAVRG
jgi:hypothetical protein